MKIALMILVLLCSSCAMQMSDVGEEAPANETENSAFMGDGNYPGGQSCSPPIELVINGKTYKQPIMCPFPSRPDPDPEGQFTTENGLVDPVISPTIQTESLH